MSPRVAGLSYEEWRMRSLYAYPDCLDDAGFNQFVGVMVYGPHPETFYNGMQIQSCTDGRQP